MRLRQFYEEHTSSIDSLLLTSVKEIQRLEQETQATEASIKKLEETIAQELAAKQKVTLKKQALDALLANAYLLLQTMKDRAPKSEPIDDGSSKRIKELEVAVQAAESEHEKLSERLKESASLVKMQEQALLAYRKEKEKSDNQNKVAIVETPKPQTEKKETIKFLKQQVSGYKGQQAVQRNKITALRGQLRELNKQLNNQKRIHRGMLKRKNKKISILRNSAEENVVAEASKKARVDTGLAQLITVQVGESVNPLRSSQTSELTRSGGLDSVASDEGQKDGPDSLKKEKKDDPDFEWEGDEADNQSEAKDNDDSMQTDVEEEAASC